MAQQAETIFGLPPIQRWWDQIQSFFNHYFMTVGSQLPFQMWTKRLAVLSSSRVGYVFDSHYCLLVSSLDFWVCETDFPDWQGVHGITSKYRAYQITGIRISNVPLQWNNRHWMKPSTFQQDAMNNQAQAQRKEITLHFFSFFFFGPCCSLKQELR